MLSLARRLKAATKDLVDDLDGLENAAADCGKGKSHVQRWTDKHNDRDFVNVRDLTTLERRASRPYVTEQLCRLAGGVFVPLPDVAADPDTLAGQVMQIMGRLGALSREMTEALGDGAVDPGEAGRLLDRLADLDGESAQLRLALQTIAKGAE